MDEEIKQVNCLSIYHLMSKMVIFIMTHFLPRAVQKKDPRLKIVLVQHGLVTGYLLSFQVVDEASKYMGSCSTRNPNNEVSPKWLQVAVPIRYQQGENFML